MDSHKKLKPGRPFKNFEWIELKDAAVYDSDIMKMQEYNGQWSASCYARKLSSILDDIKLGRYKSIRDSIPLDRLFICILEYAKFTNKTPNSDREWKECAAKTLDLMEIANESVCTLANTSPSDEVAQYYALSIKHFTSMTIFKDKKELKKLIEGLAYSNKSNDKLDEFRILYERGYISISTLVEFKKSLNNRAGIDKKSPNDKHPST